MALKIKNKKELRWNGEKAIDTKWYFLCRFGGSSLCHRRTFFQAVVAKRSPYTHGGAFVYWSRAWHGNPCFITKNTKNTSRRIGADKIGIALYACDPLQIVLLKGIFSGMGSLIIGFCIGERITVPWSVLAVLAVGFVAYGLSIYFYVYAQRRLGAARTSAYYAVAPFIGTLLSLIIFQELPRYTYFIALGFMLVGAWLCAKDSQ